VIWEATWVVVTSNFFLFKHIGGCIFGVHAGC
jgi:hypothetical protein